MRAHTHTHTLVACNCCVELSVSRRPKRTRLTTMRRQAHSLKCVAPHHAWLCSAHHDCRLRLPPGRDPCVRVTLCGLKDVLPQCQKSWNVGIICLETNVKLGSSSSAAPTVRLRNNLEPREAISAGARKGTGHNRCHPRRVGSRQASAAMPSWEIKAAHCWRACR
jgi:hypothetical protein